MEDQRHGEHRQDTEQTGAKPDVGKAVTAADGEGVGALAEQNPTGGDELLEGQGQAHQQSRETELADHHPVHQTGEHHREAAQTPLKQPQPQRGGEPQGWGCSGGWQRAGQRESEGTKGLWKKEA